MELPENPAIFRFIRWGVLLLLAYGLLHTTFMAPKKPAQPVANSSGNAGCNCPDTNPLTNFSALASVLIPGSVMTPSLPVEDTIVGTGEGAACGQQATLRYALSTPNKAEIFNNLDAKEAPTETRIGAGEMLPGLERGLMGMKAGGTRTITMPPVLAFGGVNDVHTLIDHARYKFESPSDQVTAKVSLIALSPPLPTSPMPLRFINESAGNGPSALCGDTVYADITVWKLDGTKIYSTLGTHPLAITLGESNISYGIEQSILGMRENGQRMIILPPAYHKTLIPQPRKKPVPGDELESLLPPETVLVEVVLRPAPKPISPIK